MTGIVTIAKYDIINDEEGLFHLLEHEGSEWQEYWGEAGKPNYQHALVHSYVYVVKRKEEVLGFIRCRDDDGFGMYICDLLVAKEVRGNGYGKMLMDQAVKDFPDIPIYVMSDVDPYYESLGYEKLVVCFE